MPMDAESATEFTYRTGTPPREIRDFYDPKAKAIRELFEGLVFFGLVWGVAIATALVVDWLVGVIFTAASQKLHFWVALASIMLVGGGIFWRFDGIKGAIRKAKWTTTARTYGYPITLAAGLYAGYVYHAWDVKQSDDWHERSVAATACHHVYSCVVLANRIAGEPLINYAPND
jgi:hypothetical protein